MSTDFITGQKLQLRIANNAPLSLPQFIDIARETIGADSDLNLATEILSRAPGFVGYFLSNSAISQPVLASIELELATQLSSSVVKRVKELINGYNSAFINKNTDISHPDFDDERTAIHDEEDHDCVSSNLPATIFENIKVEVADENLQNPQSRQSTANKNYLYLRACSKPLLLVLLFSGFVFGLVKIEAFCEPLGLCKIGKPKVKPIDKNDPSPGAPYRPIKPKQPYNIPLPGPRDAPLRDQPLW